MYVLTPSIIAQASASHRFLRWLYHLGGPGLIILGLVDNSVVPIVGSMDFVTVLLCANDKSRWIYYVVMATAGAVSGGYITYRLARGDENSRIARWIKRSKAKKFRDLFDRWGYGAIVVPAMLPPPLPMVPFLLAAGAAQYPRGKFLAALTIGRTIRYTILGLLGYLYGRWIITVIRMHAAAIAAAGTLLVASGVVIALIRLRRQATV